MLVVELRKLLKENYIKATLVEAKRLNYSIEALQEIVKVAFEETK